MSALTLPVNPYPRDGWFDSQYRLFGRFPGEDDYTPIAVPAVLYKIVHWLALLAGVDLKGELYLASLAQNSLLFLSACFVYYTCKYASPSKVAGFVAVAFLLFILSTGLAQAFWSENVTLAMFAAVLYLNTKIYYEQTQSTSCFWRRAFSSSLLTGLLVITRMIPALLIPAVAFLLYGRHSHKRLVSYTALACLTTGLLAGGMLASNYARFGRAEITNSSGRHLWQGVTPIVDTALAESPEFQELEALNPRIQSKNWYEIRLPDDGRRAFDGEQLFGRLASEAIRSHPFLYLRLGLSKFATTIWGAPYALGSDSKGSHHVLAADPLTADRPLPPLGGSLLTLPTRVVAAGADALKAVLSLGQLVYPIAIFFVLATYSALTLQTTRPSGTQHVSRSRIAATVKYARSLHALFGGLLLGAIYLSDIPHPRLTRGLCALILLLQVAMLGGDDARMRQEARGSSGKLVVYTFLALMFFGSLWLSWQVETGNARNVLPYSPFLSVMLAISLAYWFNVAEERGVVAAEGHRAGASGSIRSRR